MNERLEKEIEQYTKESLAIKFPVLDRELITSDIRHTAQYFYNLALEDVRKEVERLTDKMKNAQTPTETHKCYQGGRLLGYEDVLNFLNQLSK